MTTYFSSANDAADADLKGCVLY